MKKSFTLIEVMISIVIFSLLVLFMSNVITSLSSSINTLDKTYIQKQKQKNLINCLYMDILESKKIEILNDNKNYSIVKLETKNSLYNFSFPFVIWYVSKRGNSLMRLESYKNIDLPTRDGKLDKFLEVNIFKIYKNKNKYFIFIKDKKGKNIYFEI